MRGLGAHAGEALPRGTTPARATRIAMASRMVAPETPAPALSASSSANSWEVVASDDDDDGADVTGEEDDTPPHESDTRERRTEQTPSCSSDSSAGSAGASAAMRRLREAMVAEGTREEERTTSTPKRKKREPARASRAFARPLVRAALPRPRAVRARVCGAGDRHRTRLLGVFSRKSLSDARRSVQSANRRRGVRGVRDVRERRAEENAEEKKPPPRSMFSRFPARFLLRRATRFETFAAFARLGKRLRESIASRRSASSETRASAEAIEKNAGRTRRRREAVRESFAPNRRSRGTERIFETFRNREPSRSVLRGVLAFAVVAALALAAAARTGVGRSTWRVATSATAAAAAARSAAPGPAALKFAHPVEIQNRDGSLATRPYRRSIESAYAVPGVTTLFAPARGERRQTVREASWSRGVVESCRKESQKVP